MTSEPALTLESATMLRFPPFPAPPDGVTLISFTAFRPSGIRVPIDDDDDPSPGGGRDSTEKKKKRKKKGVSAQTVQVAPERPKMWWEVWEELEDVRRNAYNENETPVDRLCQAGVDFKNGRTWPTAQHGVQHVWDIFRIYLGLLQQVPGPVKDAVPVEDAVPAKDAVPVEDAVPVNDAVPDADARSDDSEMDDDDAGSSGDQDDVERRLESFLNDPEMSMKIFFSSYFREKGLIWSEPRCQTTPILVSFFLRYLIRSRVFPEPEYERPIKRALEVTELARLELPNSWKIGRELPDALSDGCRGLWGSMQVQWVPPPPADPSPDSIVEPGAKRQKLDESDGPDADVQEPSSPKKTSVTAADAYVDIAADAELNPPLVGGGWGTATDGENLEGWGASTDDWEGAHATIDDDDSPNPVMSELLPSVIEALPTWDVKPPTLLPVLGPTVLPLTHTTGVVEQSTRRIVRVDPPRVPRLLAQNAPAAEAVEEDLACRFARVVLAPWERLSARTYETGSDVLPPTVLSTSRGVAVLDEEDVGEGKAPAVAHRPWKDEIGVLVDPKLTDVFIAGMGLGAIWVEIVRSPETETGSAGAGASKKGIKGKKKEVPKYWYMEQLVHQLPSFYMDKPEDN
ncbi:hypothetical protein EDB92DRAFT_1955918 [Lactarius akahatsu]|uniref:Uncharacterized protein n=1 Tax=Lactarius akahatsu TaxID=416441 RepID=A0AAD4Q564_9AGAM|nr:hypothetical protein EDB92DRAFT_1955918 [Lactarius akahatsu]